MGQIINRSVKFNLSYHSCCLHRPTHNLW